MRRKCVFWGARPQVEAGEKKRTASGATIGTREATHAILIIAGAQANYISKETNNHDW
jgi:hypothetical protein